MNGPSDNYIKTATETFSEQAEDVSTYNLSEETLSGQSLKSNGNAIMNEVYTKIGPSQVTSSALEFSLSWLTEKSINIEHDQNWKDA